MCSRSSDPACSTRCARSPPTTRRRSARPSAPIPKSGYDLERVLQELGTGEAIVTVMSEKGAPTPVAWTRLRAPQGLMSPTPDPQIEAAVKASPLLAKYGTAIDRESAREILTAKMNAADEAQAAAEAAAREGEGRCRVRQAAGGDRQGAGRGRPEGAAGVRAAAEEDRRHDPHTRAPRRSPPSSRCSDRGRRRRSSTASSEGSSAPDGAEAPSSVRPLVGPLVHPEVPRAQSIRAPSSRRHRRHRHRASRLPPR